MCGLLQHIDLSISSKECVPNTPGQYSFVDKMSGLVEIKECGSSGEVDVVRGDILKTLCKLKPVAKVKSLQGDVMDFMID